MTIQIAQEVVGGLSSPDKMPGKAYSISARRCITGTKLRKVKNSVCSFCYALKGRYNFSNVQNAMEKRFNSLFRPDWVESMAFLINAQEKSGFFRWHDSGDLQSVEHLENIVKVCNLTPLVKHWLPTREYSIVANFLEKHGSFPDNLNVRLSSLLLDGPAPVAMAKRFGVTTSGVCKAGFSCPAPFQNNKCGDCRACWNKSVENVNYKKH